MKRVRLTIHPQGLDNPPLYERLTDAPSLTHVQTVNWNIQTPPAGFLLRLRGDYRQFEDVLATDPDVTSYELIPVTDRECYCYLRGEGTAAARALWENFTRGSLLTVPPVEWNADGSSTFTLVGTEADIQAAVDGVPDGVAVDVERVGGKRVTAESVGTALSVRQREAVLVALEVGYYDVPRAASVADVADELGCATSTAGEHLRRAESAIVHTLFE